MMTDPEKTQPGNKWAEAEVAVDDVLAAIIKSPWSWVIIAASHGIAFLLGVWML